jgi:hypothetical protein
MCLPPIAAIRASYDLDNACTGDDLGFFLHKHLGREQSLSLPGVVKLSFRRANSATSAELLTEMQGWAAGVEIRRVADAAGQAAGQRSDLAGAR